MRITKAVCQELLKRTEVVGRPFFWDDTVPGFGVRLNSPGRLAYILRYRVKGEKRQQYLTLGEFPATTPENARAEATRIKTEARFGRDLVAERDTEAAKVAQDRKAAERRALPFTQVLDAWRASVEAVITDKTARGESASYERALLRLETAKLRPAFASETVGSLDPDRFQAFLRLQPSVSGARSLRSLLARVVTFARAWLMERGMKVGWPAKFEVAGKVRSRSHRYSLAEAARIWIAAGALGRRGALIRFMLLTGCRRGEAQTVEWGHLVVDDPAQEIGPHWNQPPNLTKNRLPHRVPLVPAALALLRWLPPREARRTGESPLVFAGRGGKPVGDWTVVRRAMLEGAKLEVGTLHDFRRTLVSTLGDRGFDPQVADSLLNHSAAATMGGVMGVYQRSELWTKRVEALNLWADLLLGQVAAQLKVEPGPAAWGFDKPFVEARIVRPERKGTRVQAKARRRKAA